MLDDRPSQMREGSSYLVSMQQILLLFRREDEVRGHQRVPGNVHQQLLLLELQHHGEGSGMQI